MPIAPQSKSKIIAYIILVHNNIDHLQLLVSALTSEGNEVFIHCDKKSNLDLNPFKDLAKVYIMDDRVEVKWGAWGIAEATLRTLKIALANSQADRFVLLSGADYPLKSQADIQNYLYRDDSCYIDSALMNMSPKRAFQRRRNYQMSSADRVRYYSLFDFDRKIRTPKKFLLCGIEEFVAYFFSKAIAIDLFYGGNWWALTRAVAKYVCEVHEKDSSLRNLFRTAHCPDESFFQTVIENSDYGAKIKPAVTFTRWQKGANCPENISYAQIDELRNCPSMKEHFLFARKFVYDEFLVRYIQEELW